MHRTSSGATVSVGEEMADSRKDAPARSAAVRRQRMWWLVGGLLTTLLAMLAATLSTGSAAPSPLLDPGGVVRWGTPILSALGHLASIVTMGAFACCATIVDPQRDGGSPGRGRSPWATIAQIGTVAAIAWTLLQTLQLVLANAVMTGQSLGVASSPAALLDFLTGTEWGGTLAWSVVLTALVAVLAVLAITPADSSLVLIVGAVALLPTAATGHAASSGNHALAVSSMWLHLVAMSLWIGGLVVLMLMGGRVGPQWRVAVTRFSAVAGWAFAIVLGSGLINAVIRLNSPIDVLRTEWGQLLLVKSVLFVALGAAGYAHRRFVLGRWAANARPGRVMFWRVAGGEVLVMGAVVGVSVALGGASPPASPPRISDAFTELTGHPAPPPLGLQTLLSEWRWEPIFLLAAIAGAVSYLRWVARLRRRGDEWPPARTVSWLVGLVLFTWAVNGGLDVYGSVQFSAHMAQHMLVVMFLPIFYVLAAPVSLAFRALPQRGDGAPGPREYLLRIMHSRSAQFFAHPLVASLNVVVSMAVFYLTPLFEYTLGNHAAHVAMIVHFSLAGFVFINILIGVDPGPRRPFYPLRLVLLLPSMLFHTFFGLGLLSSASLLGGVYYARLSPDWVADPLADQQLAAALTWAIGELPVLVLAVLIAMKWIRADEGRDQRRRRDTPEVDPGDGHALAVRGRSQEEPLTQVPNGP